METFFVADVGGTKSDLAIFSRDEERNPLVTQRYENGDFDGPEQIFDDFLTQHDPHPKHGCVAIAGPVRGNEVALTNLPWVLNANRLEKVFGFEKLFFINDLTAVASSIPVLQGETELYTLQPGKGESEQSEICGIIAPGTGLGEGLLVRCGDSVLVRGSEGGHCDFAPVDEVQLRLLEWMQREQMPVSYEMLASGSGLPNLFRFCHEYLAIPVIPDIDKRMVGVEDITPLIVTGALQPVPCPCCRKTIELFLAILGSEAGNMALKIFCLGGIYLGGGILPRLTGRISFNGFLAGFRAKGQMSSLMQDFPIHLILRPDAALLGAARLCWDILNKKM